MEVPYTAHLDRGSFFFFNDFETAPNFKTGHRFCPQELPQSFSGTQNLHVHEFRPEKSQYPHVLKKETGLEVWCGFKNEEHRTPGSRWVLL